VVDVPQSGVAVGLDFQQREVRKVGAGQSEDLDERFGVATRVIGDELIAGVPQLVVARGGTIRPLKAA